MRQNEQEALGQQDISMCKGQELADIIEDSGYTIERFCEIHNLDIELVQDIIKCTVSITDEIAEMLFKATKFPEIYWL